jgi:hypothetical protein
MQGILDRVHPRGYQALLNKVTPLQLVHTERKHLSVLVVHLVPKPFGARLFERPRIDREGRHKLAPLIDPVKQFDHSERTLSTVRPTRVILLGLLA